MEDLIDLIATNSSASEISDKVKELLYARAGEKIENARPVVASMMFDDQEPEQEDND